VFASDAFIDKPIYRACRSPIQTAKRLQTSSTVISCLTKLQTSKAPLRPRTMTPNAPGLGPSSGPSGPSGPAGPSPTFLEPSRAISPDPAQGHREQDLAWSRSSTPNSSSAQGQGPASGQPKSILQPSHTHAAAGPEIGVTSQAGERAEKTAGATLEPEAATQAAGKGAGTGVEGSTRASEGGVRSIKLMDADKQGNHTQDKEEGGEKRLGGKSAGLTLPRRAQAALASAEIQMKFISLYTNGTSYTTTGIPTWWCDCIAPYRARCLEARTEPYSLAGPELMRRVSP
jgi:hypothetical protein